MPNILVYNCSVGQTGAVKNEGSEVAASTSGLLSSLEIIFSCLGFDLDNISPYEGVISAPGGVKNKIFVDISTVYPDT